MAAPSSFAPPAASGERMIRAIFQLLAISFGAAGTVFLLFPDATVQAANVTGSLFGAFPPAPPSQLRFWLSLGVSYMALVTILAVLIQRDPTRYRHLMPVLAAGKFCSSSTSLLFFVFSSPTFLYLLTFLVDGSITLTVLGCYRWIALQASPDASQLRIVRGWQAPSEAAAEKTRPPQGDR